MAGRGYIQKNVKNEFSDSKYPIIDILEALLNNFEFFLFLSLIGPLLIRATVKITSTTNPETPKKRFLIYLTVSSVVFQECAQSDLCFREGKASREMTFGGARKHKTFLNLRRIKEKKTFGL